jgi:4-hydroxy-2-oxoheptanedioate aldolase
MQADGSLPTYGTLKERLRSGEACFGFWAHLYSPLASELLAAAGFDCVMIDLEHGGGSYLDAISQMQAVKGHACTPLLRVPWNDPVEIKRALDAGAMGVMVPAVSSAEEAKAAVAACKYPPLGMRGAAPGVIRAADYGLKAGDYLREIDAKVLTILQIETVRGVEAIDEICAVEGVDMVFVGPMDLSADAGRIGQTDHAEVQALIERVEQAAPKRGVALGSIVFPGRTVPQLLDRGHRLILSHSDLDFLREGARTALAEMRAAAGG